MKGEGGTMLPRGYTAAILTPISGTKFQPNHSGGAPMPIVGVNRERERGSEGGCGVNLRDGGENLRKCGKCVCVLCGSMREDR